MIKWLSRLFGNNSSGGPVRSKQHDFTVSSRDFLGDAGCIEGNHYTDFVEKVKELKRSGQRQEAIDLLAKLIDATEAESAASNKQLGVAPWYYEQLAVLFRQEKRLTDEVNILERYQEQKHAPGVGPAKLSERLTKARDLLRCQQGL